MSDDRRYTAFFPFCGSGLGALGFARASARVLGRALSFRVLGGLDFDAMACADFELLTGAPALRVDVRDLSPERLRAVAGADAPDVVFLSPPCKGASTNVSDALAATERYAEMNQLALVWTRLMLATWRTPPRLVLLENVPGIERRARRMLTELVGVLRARGYAVHTGTHCCGELGGLAQRRRRFLLVARHTPRVPALLMKPPARRVRAVGEVLVELPMPDAPSAGPMHRLPRIQWMNWLRLALITAGRDWKTLPAGPFALRRAPHDRCYGVLRWDEPAGTVTGTPYVGTGPFSVADPRLTCAPRNGAYGVLSWHDAARTITGALQIDNGFAAVSDPRVERALRECPDPVPVIRADDGTWHRPLTTLELAVLQGLPATLRGKPLVLSGTSDAVWREHIGNGTPVATFEAVARSMLLTLAHAESAGFSLAADGAVWVRGRRAIEAPAAHPLH
jgi:site-specific DNA-cytosine methylase